MRSVTGSRTSTNSAADASKTPRSKSRLNDSSRKLSLGTNKSNPHKKPTQEQNKEAVDIQPLVYSFRVPSNPSPGSVMNALLPPYWLYHDHAFGVIWMLFHQDKKYIGITQLHWCLRFLLDLKNTGGEYTGDINVCIQAVQDDLIEQYANLGTAIENQESLKSKSNDANVRKVETSENEVQLEPNPEQKKAEESSKENLGEKETSLPPNCQKSKLGGISKCSIAESKYVTAQSLTYNQMISRGPTPYTEQTPLEQIYTLNKNTTDIPTSTPDIAAMLTSDTSPPAIPLAEMGTEELISFLDGSRREHIERIKKEIERLYDLEKFMEGIDFDKQGFEAYITNDLVRRLDKLDGNSVVREVVNLKDSNL